MNKNKGITLVALVITIIVLIILAGVSINAVQNGGIINNAKLAKNEYNEEKVEEETELTKWNQYMETTQKDTAIKADFEKQGLSVTFKNSYMTGIEPGTKVGEIKVPADYKICNIDGTDIAEGAATTTLVTTGMVIKKNNEEVGRIIIYGEVDCDGSINMSDASDACNIWNFDNYIEQYDIKEYQIIASDVNHDGYRDSQDDNLIKDVYMGDAKIDQNQKASLPIVKNYKWYLEEYMNNLPKEFTDAYKVYYNEEKSRYQITVLPDTVTIGEMKEKLNDADATIKVYNKETGEYETGDDVMLVKGAGIYKKFATFSEKSSEYAGKFNSFSTNINNSTKSNESNRKSLNKCVFGVKFVS